MITRSKTNQKGFTIIELMIATSVLSVILVLVATVMINIGNLYYKGVNQSRVQDNVRAITDDVSQQLKFAGGNGSLSFGNANYTAASGQNHYTVNTVCFNSIRYSYVLGQKIGDSSQPDPGGTGWQIDHVLWRDSYSGLCGQNVPELGQTNPYNGLGTPGTDGTEMIASNSRLTDYNISQDPSTNSYQITVGVAYGDSDLLTATQGTQANSVLCKGGTGDQYCATSFLQTNVGQRL